MIFEILAQREDELAVFTYDNMTNHLKAADGTVFEFTNIQENSNQREYKPFDKDRPLVKSKAVNTIKIQLGLSCNYSCDYCSQKFVERAPETSKKDIDAFLEKFDTLEFDEARGLKVEFWGGEPLVYWKTLRPLAEAIKSRFDSWTVKPRLTMITNGSILTDEMIDWLMMMDFGVSISHDGPGQSVRGPDPFDDPEQKERILGFYRQMRRLNKSISFNAMLNSKNQSRKAIRDWFVNLTGDKDVPLGEGGIVDAYDEDGITNSLLTKADHFKFRREAFAEMYEEADTLNFNGIMMKVMGFGQSVLNHENAKYLGQKCGMDDEHNLAVDLRGNVLTCQNVSSAEVSKNEEPHLGGNLSSFDDVKISSSTHWSNRDECSKCPVLHLCKGACMFLDKKFWTISCANSYSDNVALFALAFTQLTGGFVPSIIKGDGLPLDRQDIWGTMAKHEETPIKKVIPIKVVTEKVAVIDEVPVYGKSRIEQL